METTYKLLVGMIEQTVLTMLDTFNQNYANTANYIVLDEDGNPDDAEPKEILVVQKLFFELLHSLSEKEINNIPVEIVKDQIKNLCEETHRFYTQIISIRRFITKLLCEYVYCRKTEMDYE